VAMFMGSNKQSSEGV